MPSTKSVSTIQASASNAAGATTTSSTLDGHTAYAMGITAQITNGGTGPTVGCNATVNVSGDNVNFFFFAQVTAGTTASTTYSWAFDIPPEFAYAQVVFNGNTVQAVTVVAQGYLLTAL